MKKIRLNSAPNPQGKAAMPVLNKLQQTGKNIALFEGDANTLARAYLFSTLVLSAEFNFEPRPGQTYYLYWKTDQWRLSLIAPEDDPSARMGRFFAACHLGEQWIWHLEVMDHAPHKEALAAFNRFYMDLREFLSQHPSLDEQLPWYAAHLPFYRRMATRALALRLRQATQHTPLSLPSNLTL